MRKTRLLHKCLLHRISQPSDLKISVVKRLKDLAEEIRQRIIEALSVNGGHLTSNLGIVELTIALHRVFDSPHDRSFSMSAINAIPTNC